VCVGGGQGKPLVGSTVIKYNSESMSVGAVLSGQKCVVAFYIKQFHTKAVSQVSDEVAVAAAVAVKGAELEADVLEGLMSEPCEIS
jgi:hypothetical protein